VPSEAPPSVTECYLAVLIFARPLSVLYCDQAVEYRYVTRALVPLCGSLRIGSTAKTSPVPLDGVSKFPVGVPKSLPLQDVRATNNRTLVCYLVFVYFHRPLRHTCIQCMTQTQKSPCASRCNINVAISKPISRPEAPPYSKSNHRQDLVIH
jgi:hypothetical protein